MNGPGRPSGNAAAADSPEGTPTEDFASVLKGQLPVDGKFEALQNVKSALENATTEAEPKDSAAGADIAALLAEISQPLPPTAIPLVPVATGAPAAAPALDPSAGDSGSQTRNAADPLTATLLTPRTDGGKDGAGEFAGREDSPADPGSGQKPAFRLPETSPLAAAHALSQSSNAAGPAMSTTASHANLLAQQPIHSPQWSSEVGQGLVWMAKNDVQTAQLSINPPQLGPIEITLSLGKDQASAHFSSPYADVREILQQALPRLREILEGAGVQLGQADVSAQQQQAWQQPDRNGRRADTPEFGLEHATLRGADAVNEAAPVRVRRGLGLVDTFV
jgi:flagellar hook-length control protein FliK